MKRIIMIAFSFFLVTEFVFAGNIKISQIDTSELFLKQKINLYVNVNDSKGNPVRNLTKKNIKIYESKFKGRVIKIDNDSIDVVPHVNINNGINFYLMIDNSGSMLYTMKGVRTMKESRRRITLAKKTVSSFLDAIDNPSDRVGLGSYNTYFESHSMPSGNIERVKNYLNDIEKPTHRERFTEIYGSLSLAVNEFKKTNGRRVIILLTDGINHPYYRLTGKLHDVFGKKTYNYKEPIELCNEEGVSIFAVYFGKKGGIKDQHHDKIARETGGMVYKGNKRRELENVYKSIRRQILSLQVP